MNRLALAVVTLTLLAACKGDTGPMGPEGPPGPGAGSVVMTGTLDQNGFGQLHLPPSVGTIASPPNVACYVTADPAQGVYEIITSDWIAVSDSIPGPEVLVQLQTCAIWGHTDHVDVGIGSFPSRSFIIVAAPSF